MCVYVLVTSEGPAKTVDPISSCCFGADSGGPKEPCIRWGRDPTRKGQFWGLSDPFKVLAVSATVFAAKGIIQYAWHIEVGSRVAGVTCGLLSEFLDLLFPYSLWSITVWGVIFGKWRRRWSACLIFSERELTFVHPTQPVEIFCNVYTPFGTLAIPWHPWKILRRSSQGNPSVGEGVKRKRSSQI